MSTPFKIAALCLAAWMSAAGANNAHALDYDESVHGDLSDDPNAPTSLGTLSVGSHNLQATFVRNDYDLATFTIAPGTYLDSIVLNAYGGSTLSFSGIQAGPVWTADLGFDVDPAPLLGWVLFGETMIGTNILDDYALGADTIGFIPPLSAGTYTLELQETGPFAATAQFTLNVVPEPSTFTLASVAVASSIIAARTVRRRPRLGT